jgi:hypothetical protein
MAGMAILTAKLLTNIKLATELRLLL